MADPVQVTPSNTPSPAPAASTASPAPVTNTPVSEAPVVAPVAVQAPETVLAQAIDKPVTPQPTPAPVAVEPVVAKEPEKAVQSEEPAPTPSPVYDAFKAPEGVTLDQERVGKFSALLADLEVKGKADHALVQEFGQKAVDFHVSEIKQVQEDLNKLYTTAWEKQKTDWKDTFLKDPNIGGDKFQGTVDSALTFIRTHGGTPEQQTEFRNLMESSGLGNHPAMIRLLANAGRAMQEGAPLAATTPVPTVKSRTATLYGKLD